MTDPVFQNLGATFTLPATTEEALARVPWHLAERPLRVFRVTSELAGGVMRTTFVRIGKETYQVEFDYEPTVVPEGA